MDNTTLDDIRRIIASFSWRFAKTMPKNPHWYTVKNKNDKKMSHDYETLYRYIYDNHYLHWFYGKPYKCLRVDDYIYWIMTDDISESIIINRRVADADNDRQDRS